MKANRNPHIFLFRDIRLVYLLTTRTIEQNSQVLLRVYWNDNFFRLLIFKCLVTSQPAHPRVKCSLIVPLNWRSLVVFLNKRPQLSLFLGPTQFTSSFSINKLCMKLDLVSFECCGCRGLGIFRFNRESHEGLVCFIKPPSWSKAAAKFL